MINYSLTRKKSNFSKESQEGKWYATAQYTEVQSIEGFIRKVCHRFHSMDAGQVMSVLHAVTETLYHEMLEGRRVEVEPLGEFYPVINGVGAKSRANFARANIKDVKVNWVPGKRLSQLKREAKFKLTSTRKVQEEAKRKSRKCVQMDIDAYNATMKEERKDKMIEKWRTEKDGEKYALILSAIKENPQMSVTALKEVCGISLYETKNIINKMRDTNLIKRMGPKKGGYWEIVTE